MVVGKCQCGGKYHIVWDKDEETGETVSSHATCDQCLRNMVIPWEPLEYWLRKAW